MQTTCKCGEIIPDENLTYYNKCNEEGEEYCEFDASCNICKREYTTSQWGECDNMEDAKDTLTEYIKLCNQ